MKDTDSRSVVLVVTHPNIGDGEAFLPHVRAALRVYLENVQGDQALCDRGEQQLRLPTGVTITEYAIPIGEDGNTLMLGWEPANERR